MSQASHTGSEVARTFHAMAARSPAVIAPRQIDHRPTILIAAVLNAFIVVGGLIAYVEYHKYKLREGMQQVQQKFQELDRARNGR